VWNQFNRKKVITGKRNPHTAYTAMNPTPNNSWWELVSDDHDFDLLTYGKVIFVVNGLVTDNIGWKVRFTLGMNNTAPVLEDGAYVARVYDSFNAVPFARLLNGRSTVRLMCRFYDSGSAVLYLAIYVGDATQVLGVDILGEIEC
jgi:hypothetical protein